MILLKEVINSTFNLTKISVISLGEHSHQYDETQPDHCK